MNQRKKRSTRNRTEAADTGSEIPAGQDSGDDIRAEAGRRLSAIDAALERASREDARTFLEQSRQTGGQ